MTTKQLTSMKTEIAKRILPNLVDPEGYGPADLSMAECATLLSSNEKNVMTPAQVGKLERAALAELGDELRSKGVTSVADCIPPRRI